MTRRHLPIEVTVEHLPDGSHVITNTTPVVAAPTSVPATMLARSLEHPERVMIAERSGDGWRELRWAEVASRALRLAVAFRRLGLGEERPVAVLSDNSVEHWIVLQAGLLAGIPVASISIHYSLLAGARSKLDHTVSTVHPGLVFAEQTARFADGLRHLHDAGLLEGVTLVTDDGTAPDALTATTLAALESSVIDDESSLRAEAQRHLATFGPERHARYLFTSGSTGMPKGVIINQGMLAASARAVLTVKGIEHPTVFCDWMPWSHAGAGWARFALVTASGASLYLDDGKPTSDQIARTIENIRMVKPTHYVGAPVAWNLLVDAMERDRTFVDAFLPRLRDLQYGSAAMAQSTHDRLQAIMERERGERAIMAVGYGASESILICQVWWPTRVMGQMGLPVPGNAVRLVPVGDKLEVRVQGPMVTPGYLLRPDLTAAAFDEDGWYRTGDAARFNDPDDITAGLVFDGRIAEQFKLDTGTWVSAGTLRLQIVSACAPLVRDAVICGIDRHEIGLLLWRNDGECAAMADDPTAPPDDPLLLDALQRGIEKHNAANPSSSTRVGRFLVLDTPPSMEDHEITEKGYVNQGNARSRRAADIDRLFAALPDSDPAVRIL